jgi:hypothetical protein
LNQARADLADFGHLCGEQSHKRFGRIEWVWKENYPAAQVGWAFTGTD